MMTIRSEDFAADLGTWIRRASSEPVQIRNSVGADVVVISAEEYSTLMTSRLLRRLPARAA